MGLDQNLKKKFDLLLDWFKSKGKAIVALSGGVDSSLLAYVANMALGNNALAVTAVFEAVSSQDVEDAEKIALTFGIRHRIVGQKSLNNNLYIANPIDRCYFCRADLASELKKVAEEEGIDTIVSGTVSEDFYDYRPGLAALREAGVESPLADIGFSKDDVRRLAKYLNLPNADKPSNSCLSARIPYGEKITLEKLSRIDKAEIFIRQLTGVKQVRVRDHEGIARVEVGRDERALLFNEKTMDKIVSELKEIGFNYVTMDLEGYRSGSMNICLKQKNLQPSS